MSEYCAGGSYSLDDLLFWKQREQRPRRVVLCGSTRFLQAFQEASLRETLAGNIVLTIGCDTKSDVGLALSEGDKFRLDLLHLYKIDWADEVLVLNVGGYMGLSTTRELIYAARLGKPVRFLELGVVEVCSQCGRFYYVSHLAVDVTCGCSARCVVEVHVVRDDEQS